MNITERIVSVKRHTVGYVIGNREYTRPQTVSLVRKGQVANARLVNSQTYGKHVIGKGVNLYDLPTRFKSSRVFASAKTR